MSNIIKHRKPKDDIGAKIVSYIVISLTALFALLPFWILISASVTDATELSSLGYSLFPKKISFEAYSYILKSWKMIGKAYLLTFIVTLIGTTLSLIITSFLAFGVHWKKTPGRKIITVLLVVTLLFNGGAVASYIVYTNFLHVQNTIWGLILPGLLMNGFSVILFINYFKNTISKDFLEAAEIDGANLFQIYFNIYMPISLPIIATLGLSTAIAYWNDWNNGLYYISDPDVFTIQLLLKQIQESAKFLASNPEVGQATNIPNITIQMAIAVVGILPILIAYPFFQRYFVAGITLGGVKE